MRCSICDHEMIEYKHQLDFHGHRCINGNCTAGDVDSLKTAVLSKFKNGNGAYFHYGLVMIYSMNDSKFRLTGSNRPVKLQTIARILADYGEEL